MAPQYFHHPAHELAELVRQRLSLPGCAWSRGVRANIHDDGVVVLTGRVRSYYHKQLAQEALRRLTGIGRIHNELCVERPASSERLSA
uniref:BON domain-containing protein n=1 Tax=Schlesneria paludicola TaxID=360056 RepID=A0A7C4LJV6_9PLAN